MQTTFHVGLSAQLALQKRLETIANNMANASTAGFRAEEVRFETALAGAGNDPIAFAVSGPTYLSRRAGDLVRTDNQFDVAVEGNAWLAIQTPTGQAYTRDGRMTMRFPPALTQSVSAVTCAAVRVVSPSTTVL